jgi:hypothetical protein
MADVIKTSPHKFKPIRIWDRTHKNGRCRHCFLPKFAHPVRGWVLARPLFDKSEADLGMTKKG